MITYDELKTALTDISNICHMTACDRCPLAYGDSSSPFCTLKDFTPNNWPDNLSDLEIKHFADRGAYLVENGYIDE